MAADAVRRDGGMLTPGLGYPLAGLAGLGPLPGHSTGFAGLDGAEGMQPGAVWTLATPSTVGATAFAVEVAVAASQTGRVLLVNGHLASHLLLRRLESVLATGDPALATQARNRIELCSQMFFPSVGENPGDAWLGSGYDVMILDTVDESMRPGTMPGTTQEWIRQLRWVREMARENNTTLLLTTRTPSPEEVGLPAFRTTCAAHWARPVFEDISDVRIEMCPAMGGLVDLSAYRRGHGTWQGRGRVSPKAGRLQLATNLPNR